MVLTSSFYIDEWLRPLLLQFILCMSRDTLLAALWNEVNLANSSLSGSDLRLSIFLGCSFRSTFMSWLLTEPLTGRTYALQSLALMVLVLPLLFKTNRIDALGPDLTGRSDTMAYVQSPVVLRMKAKEWSGRDATFSYCRWESSSICMSCGLATSPSSSTRRFREESGIPWCEERDWTTDVPLTNSDVNTVPSLYWRHPSPWGWISLLTCPVYSASLPLESDQGRRMTEVRQCSEWGCILDSSDWSRPKTVLTQSREAVESSQGRPPLVGLPLLRGRRWSLDCWAPLSCTAFLALQGKGRGGKFTLPQLWREKAYLSMIAVFVLRCWLSLGLAWFGPKAILWVLRFRYHNILPYLPMDGVCMRIISTCQPMPAYASTQSRGVGRKFALLLLQDSHLYVKIRIIKNVKGVYLVGI